MLPAEIRQPAVDPEEHLLREVLSARAVLDGPGDQREHQILVPIDQLLKPALVAPSAAVDELPLVRRLHSPRY